MGWFSERFNVALCWVGRDLQCNWTFMCAGENPCGILNIIKLLGSCLPCACFGVTAGAAAV